MNAVERFRQVAENNSEKKILYDAGKEYTYSWIRFVPVLQN